MSAGREQSPPNHLLTEEVGRRQTEALTYISSPTMGRGEQDAADFALTGDEQMVRTALRNCILMARAALAVTRSA